MSNIAFTNGVLQIKNAQTQKITPLENGEKHTLKLQCDQNLVYFAKLLEGIEIKSVKKNGVSIPFYASGGLQPNIIVNEGDVIEFEACFATPPPPPISIASLSPANPLLFKGHITRLTIEVNSHEFLTTDWVLTMLNATFAIISTTTSQLVVDVTPTAAALVQITDLVNNDFSITNKPYNIATATQLTISIASISPATPTLVRGKVTRLTINVNGHQFLTTSWTLTMLNATFSVISSTTSQLVVDVTPTAVGSVQITDLVNNGYSITNKPYNVGTATEPLYKFVANGTSHYITFAQTVNAAMATANAYTVEFDLLFKIAPTTTQFMTVFGSANSGGSDSSITNTLSWENRDFIPVANRGLMFRMQTTSFYNTQVIANPSINTPYRFAACFSSNRLQIYINGNRVIDQTTTGNLNASAELFYIFRSGNFAPSTFAGIPFNGEMLNIGVHRVARYSGATYNHNAPVTVDNNTLIYLRPALSTTNVVTNEGTGGNGTSFGDTTTLYVER